MIFFFITLFVFVLLILVAIRIGFNKKDTANEEITNPVLHASGIYSIVCKSPRDKINQFKPSVEEIRKYLENSNVDIDETKKLPVQTIDQCISNWSESLNKNIEVIEQGDNKGVKFYYYDFSPETCTICSNYLKKGQFVTREELYQFPGIIPPLHLGCTAQLVPYGGKENLNETTELGMLPLFKNEIPPLLPEWWTVSHSNAVRGTVA